jgi:hypothetical protein
MIILVCIVFADTSALWLLCQFLHPFVSLDRETASCRHYSSFLTTHYLLVAGGSSPTPATLIDRLRDTFKLAEQHGLSFEKAFNLLDRDGSGGITVAELHAALQVRCRKLAKYFAAALPVVSASAFYN